MSDPQTLAVYEAAAARYAAGFATTKDVDQSQDMAAFLALVPTGGRLLDLGCGPGQWAALMRDQGYQVEATDISPAMADLAWERYGLQVRVEPFEALPQTPVYNGIWANFSLLHVPRDDFPAHLGRLRRTLTPQGALHLGMKLGKGEGRDSLGRFFAYYQEGELVALVEQAGFTVTHTRRGNGEGLTGGIETFVIVTAHG